MARAVIGGVITSTLLTLVVVPVIYTYLHAFGLRAKRWFDAGAPSVVSASVGSASAEHS